MERNVETAPPKAPVVDRVLYGVGKFVENQLPTTHANRIIGVINRYIIPKLKPEQVKWVAQHKNAIETGALVAGVGITTAEVVVATVFTIRMMKRFSFALERMNERADARFRQRQAAARTAGDDLKDIARRGRRRRKRGENIVFDRTEEFMLIQDMATNPAYDNTHFVRLFQEGKLKLRPNETVDWRRLGLQDPVTIPKKIRKQMSKFELNALKPAYESTTQTAIMPAVRHGSSVMDRIRRRLDEVLPWSLQNRELAMRRTKYKAEKVARLKAKQDEIWDALRMQMIARQEMNMELDHRRRLKEGIERGIAERLRREALNKPK